MKLKKLYLMSETRYEKNKGIIPAIEDGWWLRDNGLGRTFVPCIQDGAIFAKGDAPAYIDKGVRPVGEFELSEGDAPVKGSKIYDDKGLCYTVLESSEGKSGKPGKVTALADECIAYMPYAYGIPSYEDSPIKACLEEYLGTAEKKEAEAAA